MSSRGMTFASSLKDICIPNRHREREREGEESHRLNFKGRCHEYKHDGNGFFSFGMRNRRPCWRSPRTCTCAEPLCWTSPGSSRQPIASMISKFVFLFSKKKDVLMLGLLVETEFPWFRSFLMGVIRHGGEEEEKKDSFRKNFLFLFFFLSCADDGLGILGSPFSFFFLSLSLPSKTQLMTCCKILSRTHKRVSVFPLSLSLSLFSAYPTEGTSAAS